MQNDTAENGTGRGVRNGEEEHGMLLGMEGGGVKAAFELERTTGAFGGGGGGGDGEGCRARGKDGDDTQNLSSFGRTLMNCFISFVGAGVLGLPYAFRLCGALAGLCILTAVASISTYCMLLLIKAKYRLVESGHSERSVTGYGDVGRLTLGPRGGKLVDASLVISQTGFGIAYLVFIATNLNQMLGWSQVGVVMMCIPLLSLLVLLRHLKHLAPFSLAADIANVVGLAVVYWEDFEYYPLNHEHIRQADPKWFIFFFGVAVYCFEGMGLVLPLETNMRDKSKFRLMLVSTVTVVTSLYATFGLAGYLAFGDETESIITLNMPGSFLSKVVKLSLCTGLYLTYPIMLFPVIEILEPLVFGKHGGNGGGRGKENCFRASLVVLTAFIAAVVPDFSLFISFVGSSICSLLAFILPPLFHLKLFPHELTPTARRLDYAVICFGIGMGLIGTLQTGAEIMAHWFAEPGDEP